MWTHQQFLQLLYFFPPSCLSVEAHMLGSQRFGETHFMLIVYLIRNSNCLEGLINSWKSNGAGCVPPCHAVCVRRWNIHTVTRRRWQLRLRRDLIRFGVGSLGAGGNSDARCKARKDASNKTERVRAVERDWTPSRKMKMWIVFMSFKTQNEAGIIRGRMCNILLCAISCWCDFCRAGVASYIS